MQNLTDEQTASREKTLLMSLLLSAPGPLVLGIAVMNSQSTTQLADFFRRGVELLAIFLSWWIFHRLRGDKAADPARRTRWEHTAGLCTGAAMACSGLILLGLALTRLSAYRPGGSVTMGLVIAGLGLATNGWFWQRYGAMAREQNNPIITAQAQLYRAKTAVDLCVAAALAAVAIAPAHPATHYIDLLGSVVVAFYLLGNGIKLARTHVYQARGTPPSAVRM